MTGQSAGMGGWLWLLSLYLVVWQPVAFAAVASSWVAALPIRGWPLGLLLAVRLVVIGTGIAAARAIRADRSGDDPITHASGIRSAGALPLARAALVSAMAVDLLVYTTSIAPNDRVPGDTPWYIAWTLLVNGAWLVYLGRSRRLRVE